MIIEYSESMGSLDDVISNHSKILLDFWATWCGPCKMMTPVIETVSKEKPDVTFIKVNIDTALDIQTKYNIMSVPSFIIVKDGKIVARNNGSMNAVSLTNFLDKNL